MIFKLLLSIFVPIKMSPTTTYNKTDFSTKRNKMEDASKTLFDEIFL